MKGLDSIVALGVVVPDIHFSTLHLADQLNLFSKHSVAVKVTEFAGSTTGELARMLKDKKVDIGNRLDRRLHLLYRKWGRRQDHCATFVQTLMRWVVVVSGSNSTIRVTAALRGKTFGITKPGGGSYINTMLLAKIERLEAGGSGLQD